MRLFKLSMKYLFVLIALISFKSMNLLAEREMLTSQTILKEEGRKENFIKNTLSNADKLVQFYQSRNSEPLWLNESGLTPAGQTALTTLQNAAHEGLDPLDYKPILDEIAAIGYSQLSPEDIIKLDTMITKYLARYIEDLEGERLDPQKVNKQLHLKVKDVDPYMILAEGMTRDPSGKWLSNYSIPHLDYQKLKRLLADYREIERRGGWPQFMMPASMKLEPGKSNPLISTLRAQLLIQGDLKIEEAEESHFTKELESALKQFQRRHGLEDDGRLGKETISALNISVKDRIKQIIISMERWRWAPNEQGERHVVINIAGYYLQAFQGNEKILDMPVIIGQNFRQTPVFVSQIDLIRFNPSWHVPQSIAVKDKLPLLRKKPSYFKSKGYKIYDASGEIVDAEDVNWSDVSASHFNYKIVQSPGSANALGKLFFHINTPFDVFLHGTPDAELFKKAKRSFSSGCIRLADPMALAFFVLNNEQKWSESAILQATEGNETQNVVPPQLINVYVTYQTVWVDDQGLPHFVEDLYNQDKTIETALQKQSTRETFF